MNKLYKKIIDTLPHMKDTTATSTPSLEEAVIHIEQMDLSSLKNKLCSESKLLTRTWSTAECEVAIQYYKNFLFLNKKYLKHYPVIPPSIEIDEIWHQHILDTRTYTTDCRKIFGHYFHHYPQFGTRGKQDSKNLNIAFEVTQTLHEIEFGNRILSLWER
ncbi:glycine-rich domain-containing protein [Pseudomonas sp. NPDC089734]|uniref:glycine-rich domain-containing protein n=1 Tax=Pseudomonas sp. NPDC089734 TaxID=3364469 RepID=UPI003803A3A0